MQLELTVVCTGDTNIDNALLNNIPTIFEAFSGNLNVPNRAACPGRINIGSVQFGTIKSPQTGDIPVDSSFQPTKECL